MTKWRQKNNVKFHKDLDENIKLLYSARLNLTSLGYDKFYNNYLKMKSTY